VTLFGYTARLAKQSIMLLIAIEVDDWSHDATNRRVRGAEVGCIFIEANLPLLRFYKRRGLSCAEISQQITSLLSNSLSHTYSILQDQTAPQS